MRQCRWKKGALVEVTVHKVRVGFKPSQVKAMDEGYSWDSSRYRTSSGRDDVCVVVGAVWNGWPIVLNSREVCVVEPTENFSGGILKLSANR